MSFHRKFYDKLFAIVIINFKKNRVENNDEITSKEIPITTGNDFIISAHHPSLWILNK